MERDICVIGSANMDFVGISDVFPGLGETVLGNDFMQTFGGKGANQAVSAARLGSKVSFIGAVGNDSIGDQMIQNFKENQIDVSGIKRVNVTSGVALIASVKGENSITVIPGANREVTPDLISKNLDIIKASKIILLQCEIPVETIEYAIKVASDLNKTIILNPAPYTEINAEVLDKVTYITPNEIELQQMFPNIENPLEKLDSEKFIVTLGSKGVQYYSNGTIKIVPSEKVQVVDTTGAGDSFNGALAHAIAKNMSLEAAVEFANKVAAISITRHGAQTAMPKITDIS